MEPGSGPEAPSLAAAVGTAPSMPLGIGTRLSKQSRGSRVSRSELERDMDKALDGVSAPPSLATMTLKHCPDGRGCGICSQKDNSEDPCDVVWIQTGQVTIIAFRKWAYPPSAAGQTVGRYCYYCIRVWSARFKADKSVSDLKMEFVADKSKLENFMKLVNRSIEVYIAAGTREVKCPWAELEAELSVEDNTRAQVIAPDDHFMYLEDYTAEHGDPLTNGKKHTKGFYQGRNVVWIPGNKVHTVRKMSEQVVKKKRSRTRVPTCDWRPTTWTTWRGRLGNPCWALSLFRQQA